MMYAVPLDAYKYIGSHITLFGVLINAYVRIITRHTFPIYERKRQPNVRISVLEYRTGYMIR